LGQARAAPDAFNHINETIVDTLLIAASRHLGITTDGKSTWALASKTERTRWTILEAMTLLCRRCGPIATAAVYK
jgi:hypothetical protein